MVPTTQNELHAVVSWPKATDKKPGLIVFVHGDGPADASYEEGYYSAWEVLNEQGFATISWDKPGVGKSSGSWYNQSMADRAQEAREVIRWAKAHLNIDERKIGIWGGSQAGWVIPKVMNEEDAVAFGIAVSTAVNWQQQGRYNTTASMQKAGKTPAEIADKLQKREQITQLLAWPDAEAGYRKYQEQENQQGDISPDRWRFIGRNMDADATKDLRNIRKPLYLIVGEQDIHVDIEDTIHGYTQAVPPRWLEIKKLPDADHNMVRKEYVDMGLGQWVMAILNPRVVMDPGYFDELKRITEKEGRR